MLKNRKAQFVGALLPFICCAIALLATVQKSFSQNLNSQKKHIYHEKTEANHLHLFKLDANQMRLMVQYNLYPSKQIAVLQNPQLFTQLVGKIHKDSILPYRRHSRYPYPVSPIDDEKLLPYFVTKSNVWKISEAGYYLEVNVTGIDQVEYKLIENPYFVCDAMLIGTQRVLYVTDSAGKFVSDAVVTFDSIQCKYDSSFGGFILPAKHHKNYGTLYISRDKQFLYRTLSFSENKINTTPPKDRYSYFNTRYQGYFITNKPIYKPGDTVFYKAFLVKGKKAKPLKKEIMITAYQSGYLHVHRKWINPLSPGDYYGYFIADDSFTLDKQMVIELRDKKARVAAATAVKFEDYQLKNIDVSIKLQKKTVFPGDNIVLECKAFDRNRLPIMEGTLQLRIKLQTFRFPEIDSVAIPKAYFTKLYQTKINLDPSGFTEIVIPDSILPKGNAHYIAEAEFVSGDYEKMTATEYFNYDVVRDQYRWELTADTLRTNYYFNGKNEKRDIKIKYYTDAQYLKEELLKTPVKIHLPIEVARVEILYKDSLLTTLYHSISIPEITGKRLHDSIYIQIKSQKENPVFYRIYKNNILVASGQSSTLQFAAADKSKHSYHLQYGYRVSYNSIPQFYQRSFHLKEKELQVSISQETVVFPGQTVPIEITVTNAKKKGVKGVNLAAYAISNQLEITEPNVPYLGLVKNDKPLLKRKYTVTAYGNNYSTRLADFMIPKFDLSSNLYYQLLYPKNGFQTFTDTVPDGTTQVAFWVNSAAQIDEVEWVKVNDTLLYRKLILGNNYPVLIKPGIHKFSVRCRDRIYQFKHVKIEKGVKNFICLHSDSLKKYKLGDSANAFELSKDEQAQFKDNFLLFRFDNFLNDTLLVFKNNQLLFASSYYTTAQKLGTFSFIEKQYGFRNNSQHVNYANQSYYALGLFQSGDQVRIQWKHGYAHQFTFEKNLRVSITADQLVKSHSDSLHPKLKYISKSHPSHYLFVHGVWFNPDLKYTRETIPYQPTQSYSARSFENEYSYRDYNYLKYYGDTIIHLGDLFLYFPIQVGVRKIWLIDQQDSSFSNIRNYAQIQEQFINHNRSKYNSIQKYFAFKDTGIHFQTLLVQTEKNEWYKRQIKLKPNYEIHVKDNPIKWQALLEKEFLLYDRLVKNLTKLEVQLFKDSITENSKFDQNVFNMKSSLAKIEGYLFGSSVEYVVSRAFITLEQNGKFIKAGYSNDDGRFVLENIRPGNYNLKVKQAYYHYWIHYNVSIEGGKYYILNIKLKPKYFNISDENIYTEYNNHVMENSNADYSAMDDAVELSEGKTERRMAMSGSSREVNVMITRRSPAVLKQLENVRGRATYGSATFVDGQRVQGTIVVDKDAVSDYEEFDFKANQELNYSRLQTLIGNKDAMRVRKNFKDYAFWFPSLTTNKQGKTKIVVTYPDNATSWQTFVPAMNGKRQSGLGKLTVQSYKPVSAFLAVPSFLYENDSVQLYSRISNYTGKELEMNYFFTGTQNTWNKKLKVSNSVKDFAWLFGDSVGKTFHIQSGIKTEAGYFDAEERKVPVFSAKVKGGNTQTFMLEGAASQLFTLNGEEEGKEIIIYGDENTLIYDALEEDKNAFQDNYSLANQLLGLLLKKKLANKLKIVFTQDQKIEELIKKVKKSQNGDKLWGSFFGTRRNFFISAKTIEALYLADKMGFSNNVWLNACIEIESNIFNKSMENEQLHYLATFARIGYSFNSEYLNRYNFNHLSNTAQLNYLIAKKFKDGKINIQPTIAKLQMSNAGNFYFPGEHVYYCMLVTDNFALSLQTIELLRNDTANVQVRNSILNYLKYEIQLTSVQKLQLYSEIIAEKESDTAVLKNMLISELKINNQIVQFSGKPIQYTIKKGETLQLEKTGATLYVLSNSWFYTKTPKTDSTQFAIETKLFKRDDIAMSAITQFSSGDAVELRVKIFAKQNQFNAVAEIPIPAGFVYASKVQGENSHEVHREYRANKTVIYFDELPFGYHEFSIQLTPKFSGLFNLPPARTALLYYTQRAGYNSANQIRVK